MLGYYEAQGQPLATHVAWLREQPQDIKTVVLPHDGRTHDKVYSVSYESALRDAGFNVIVVPNQGRGLQAPESRRSDESYPQPTLTSLPVSRGLRR